MASNAENVSIWWRHHEPMINANRLLIVSHLLRCDLNRWMIDEFTQHRSLYPGTPIQIGIATDTCLAFDIHLDISPNCCIIHFVSCWMFEIGQLALSVPPVMGHDKYDCALTASVLWFYDMLSKGVSLTIIGIPIIKIRRSHDRPIFIMEIPIQEKFLYWNRVKKELDSCLAGG